MSSVDYVLGHCSIILIISSLFPYYLSLVRAYAMAARGPYEDYDLIKTICTHRQQAASGHKADAENVVVVVMAGDGVTGFSSSELTGQRPLVG